MTPRAWIAEGLGTFLLVFAGCGAIVVSQTAPGTLSHLGVALVFGLAVLSAIYAYGDISGAHINPAVTLGFWAAGRFPGRQIVPFISAQFTGAILAGGALRILFPGAEGLGETLPSGSFSQSFMLEAIMSWWLMTVIFSVSEGAKEKGLVAGIVVGSVVAMEAAFGGPISGASMNPARSLGPALITGQFHSLWIYMAAPTFGCLAAVFSFKWVHHSRYRLSEKTENTIEIIEPNS